MENYSDLIEVALDNKTWNFANDVLYKLCSDNPKHDSDDVVAAKILFIGRTYAAAIERRTKTDNTPMGDDFYDKVVIPKIIDSDIDSWFDSLRFGQPTTEQLLHVHYQLTRLFTEISNQSKRSLASKYLHFHFPSYYFIFDSRSYRSVSELTHGMRVKTEDVDSFDRSYRAFFLRCIELRNRLTEKYQLSLSPRDIDKILLTFDRLSKSVENDS